MAGAHRQRAQVRRVLALRVLTLRQKPQREARDLAAALGQRPHSRVLLRVYGRDGEPVGDGADPLYAAAKMARDDAPER